MSYQQLTEDERYQIQAMRTRHSQVFIATALGRNPSTISRELRRNTPSYGPYKAKVAQSLARSRRIEKSARSRKIKGALQAEVEAKLRLSWSPQQISGRLLLEKGIRLSHETIYQHVLRDARRRGFLRYCLRFGGYKQFRFKKSKMAARTRARKLWIHQRGAAANNRTQFGHWERDCLLGQRGGAAFLTFVDRRSRYSRIRRVEKVDVDHVSQATREVLAEHADVTKTLTNDNGVEFQRDEALQAALDIPIYFTDPSSPWQRGSIENLNGLVRQYVPKGEDIDRLADWTPQAIEETLNHRPRKTLGYRTPHEAFFGKRLRMIANQRMHFGLEFNPYV